jgi:hypothetical protein
MALDLTHPTAAYGPSRHFGAAQLLGRFRSAADINLGEGSQNRIYEYTPKSAKVVLAGTIAGIQRSADAPSQKSGATMCQLRTSNADMPPRRESLYASFHVTSDKTSTY